MLDVIVQFLIMGAVIGLIPLIFGVVKRKLGLGVGAFFACIAGSILMGVYLSLPICFIFMLLIIKKSAVKKPEFDRSNGPRVY